MNSQTSASNNSPHPKPLPHWITLVGALVLATLAAFAWAVYARQSWGFSPLSSRDLTRFELSPYMVGFIVESLVVPVALLYLFSRTSLFQRVVSGEPWSHPSFDRPKTQPLKLMGALVLLQFLALNYEWALFFLSPDRAAVGLLIVITAGLLGGWRMGLALGLVTLFISGTRMSTIEINAGRFLLTVLKEDGFGEIFGCALWDVFFRFYLINLRALSPVWAGIVAGLWAGLWGERRFEPMTALILGIAVDLGAGYLVVFTMENPADLGFFLIPSALISGLAIAAVALMVRRVQAEADRRKAEAAMLALTQAELRALRAQINPHFLFNALNAIRYFVRTDPGTARRLLLDLSEIFQRALRSGEFVPLRDEISYVEAYLALEKARLDERLQVVWAIQAEAWLDYPIPTLILQPIVENAVVHGVSRKPEGGTVHITIELANDDLVLEIEDDGPGIPPARLAEIHSAAAAGDVAIGLRNVDGRLRALYGEEYRLIVESEVGRGTRVEIRIPIEDE